MKRIVSLMFLLFTVLCLAACGGSGGDTSPASTTATGSQTPAPGVTPATPTSSPSTSSALVRSFSAASDPITIDKLVNAGTSSSAKAASANAEFYYGRFMGLDEDRALYSGSLKFKINKQDSGAAYFSDFTLLNLSKVSSIDRKVNIVTSSTDLKVAPTYNAATNYVTIANATNRFISFSVDFGNNTYFGDISKAGVIFSSDYTTMAGGNNAFAFIAQKSDSMSNVDGNDLDGDWKISIFRVFNSVPVKLSTSVVAVGGVGGHDFTAFTGVNADNGKFGGELVLNDAAAGSFFYGYGNNASTTASGTIDGVFLVSPDKELALGVDLISNTNFAAEK